jgi:alkylation response protein AidB-like acyl-CoA dehydrogenase
VPQTALSRIYGNKGNKGARTNMENAGELSVATSHLMDQLPAHEQVLLTTLQHLCDTQIEPVAEEIDMRGSVPCEHLAALAAAGLVGVTTPQSLGGQACSSEFMHLFTRTLTAACGTTWFVLTQHLGSCGQIAGSSNPVLREKFSQKMAAGEHYVGVGFGHLRRPQPMLIATVVDGGWTLTGTAPWVTGWPILSGVIFGAVLEGEPEKHLYVYADAKESDQLRSSPPLPLCAMNASETTEIVLDGLFIPTENFVRYSSRQEMARGDKNNIASNVAPPLGCAYGSLRTLKEISSQRSLPAIIAACDALEAEILACELEGRRWATAPKEPPYDSAYLENALHVRAWAIELAVRAAHMTVTAASGIANNRTHPAQRRLREAMFYTLAAQTSEIMSATLDRLSQRT